MSTYTPTEDEVHNLLLEVLRKWKSGELKAYRNQIRDVEDRIADEEDRGREQMLPKLKESLANLNERMEAKTAMIEDAYQRMVAYVDRAPQAA